MTSPLILRLQHFVRFSQDELSTLQSMTNSNMRRLRARHDLLREGERSTHVHLVLEGWAYRHKMLEDGRRQIIAFLLPGDLCNSNLFMLRQMDHSVGALSPLRYASVPHVALERAVQDRPRISHALNWDMLVASAIQREWTVSLGQRSAIERIAHLLCELFVRLDAVSQVRDNSYEIPLTQNDLAETAGITPVHVNRTLQQLRAQGLIQWKGRELHVPDFDSLKQLAMFDAGYLHLDHEGAFLDANA